MNVSLKKHWRNSIFTVLKNVIDVILEMLLLLTQIKLPTTMFIHLDTFVTVIFSLDE